MDEKLRDELADLHRRIQTVQGQEVEGLARPTTDRTKLETLALIVAGILKILLQLTSPTAPAEDNI